VTGTFTGHADATGVSEALLVRSKPAAITGFAAVASAHGKVSLTWNEVDDGGVLELIIRRLRGSEGPATPSSGTQVAVLDRLARSFTDVVDAAGQVYSYSIFAISTDETPSDPASVTVETSEGAPILSVGGTLAADATWSPADAGIYLVESDLTVPAGRTLTLTPGTIVKAKSDVRATVFGSLVAAGTVANPVVLTSFRDDTTGGDTDADTTEGNPIPPTPGDWYGIDAQPGSTVDLEHTRVSWASWVEGQGAGVRIAHCDISEINYLQANQVPTGQGFTLTDSNLRVHQQVFASRNVVGTHIRIVGNTLNGGANIAVESTITSDSVQISGNTITGITQPMRFPVDVKDAALKPSLLTGNTLTANRTNITSVRGTLAEDWTIPTGFNYHIRANYSGEGLTVPAGRTLTLAPGAIVKLGTNSSSYNGITVAGTLIAAGTVTNPVVLTSFRDDTIGGDTDADTTQGNPIPPTPGDWYGIDAQPGSTVLGQHLDIRYGNYGIYATGSASARVSVKLDDSSISSSSSICLYVSYPTADSYFHGSVRGCDTGVYSSHGSFDATHVDWGDVNGPPPYGSGAKVEGAVEIVPWVGMTSYTPPPITLPSTPAAQNPTCKDIVFLGVRGSGEPPGGPEEINPAYYDDTWVDGEVFLGLGSKVQSVFDGSTPVGDYAHVSGSGNAFVQTLLGGGVAMEDITVTGVVYPAKPVPMDGLIRVDLNPIGGIPMFGPYWIHVDTHKLSEYYASLMWGKAAAIEAIHDAVSSCGPQGSRIVLAGYSQGAWSVHAALVDLAEANDPALSHISAAVLIADPARTSNDHAIMQGTVSYGRKGVSQFWGGLGTSLDPIPTIEGNVLSYCNDLDLVCAPGPEDFVPEEGIGISLEFGSRIHGSYDGVLLRGTGAWAAQKVLDDLS
jgi:hypothetical protein